MHEQVKINNDEFYQAVTSSFAFLEEEYGFVKVAEVTPQGNATISYQSKIYRICFYYYYGELNFCMHGLKGRYELSSDDIAVLFHSTVAGSYLVTKEGAITRCVEKLHCLFREHCTQILTDYKQFKQLYSDLRKRRKEQIPFLSLKQADVYWVTGNKDKAAPIYKQYRKQLSPLQTLRLKRYSSDQ